MRIIQIQTFGIALVLALLCSCSSQQAPADNKEMELLRKETELARKETELAKKELELSKDISNANTSNTIANTVTETQTKPTTVTIRLEPVWINGVGSGLFDRNMTAVLTTTARRFSGKVNGRGVITISGVPCDEQVGIALPPTHGFGGGTKYYKRFVKCDKPVVNLGKLKIGSFDEDYGITK
jgi:hypothetical protein